MSTFAKKVTSAIVASTVVLSTVSAGINGVSAAYTNLEAANKLASLNVIVDQSENPAAYRLADTIQRQEALKVMMKLSGLTINEGACKSSFSDIADSDWACKYAEAALKAGFIAPNDEFRPHDKVSKIEALKMVMKARGIERDQAADWREGYVTAAVKAGIATAFSDYNTAAERGVMFVWAAEAIDYNKAESEDDTDASDVIGSILDGMGDDEDTEENASEDTEESNEETTTNDDVAGEDKLVVSLNPETPSDGLAQANVDRVPLLKFDVKAGSEDVTLNQLTLEFIGLGDYNKLDNVAVYNEKGEKVSKTKDFKEVEREISFDKDVVVEAGKVMTLTVAGRITSSGAENTTYGVKLTDIQASSDVEGDMLVGALLVPAEFNNVAKIKVTDDTARGKIQVGEEEILAGFEIEETEDNEDVIIKTITLHLSGDLDAEDLANLSLYADGKEIASDLEVNSDDEIVIPANYTLAADDRVKFELKGTVTSFDSTDDVLEIVFEGNDDIYAIGANSGMPIGFKDANTDLTEEDICDVRDIEGSEINISFVKGDKDETKVDVDDVLVGTLKVTANTNAYEIKDIAVTVKASTGNADDIIKDIELGGDSYDGSPASAQTMVYHFTDITLKKGEEKVLPLTFDVEDDVNLNGRDLTFEVKVIEVEDDDNDITYTGNDLNDVLSTNSFDTKKISIETASLVVDQTKVNDRTVVLGNIETVVYKAKLFVGDSDDVTINDVTFTGVLSTGVVDFQDIIDSATLNIGGKTFDADIRSDRIEFNNIDAVIEAGADDVPLLVTVNLKDNDSLNGEATMKFGTSVANFEVEDSDGERFNISLNPTTETVTTLRDNGELTFSFDTDEDTTYFTGVDKFILAGSEDVVLAKVEFDSKYEDVKVKDLVFDLTGATLADTFENIKLVAEGTTLVDGGIVNVDNQIVFENDFVISEEGKTTAYIVADVNPITDEGDVTSSSTGTVALVFNSGASEFEGDVSLDTYDSTNLTATDITSKKVTVAANTVAGINLEKATESLASEGNDSVLAKLVVDMEDQDSNKYDDGSELIEAVLKTVKINLAGAAASGAEVKLSRAGITLTGDTDDEGNTTFDTSDLTDEEKENFATIDDGKAEFDVLVTYKSDDDNDDMTIKIADISKDVKLDDGKGVEIYKVFSAKTSASSKVTEVTISR